MDYFCLLVLGISICLNCYLYFYKKKTVTTVDAQKVIADLLTGSALVKIQVIDPAGLLYRSPRG